MRYIAIAFVIWISCSCVFPVSAQEPEDDYFHITLFINSLVANNLQEDLIRQDRDEILLVYTIQEVDRLGNSVGDNETVFGWENHFPRAGFRYHTDSFEPIHLIIQAGNTVRIGITLVELDREIDLDTDVFTCSAQALFTFIARTPNNITRSTTCVLALLLEQSENEYFENSVDTIFDHQVIIEGMIQHSENTFTYRSGALRAWNVAEYEMIYHVFVQNNNSDANLWSEVERYTQGIIVDEGRASYYFERARAYEALELFEEAITDYGHAISRDSDNTMYRIARADLYMLLGDVRNALPDYRLAAEITPDVALYHFLLANAYYQLSDFDNARIEYCAYQSLDSNSINPIVEERIEALGGCDR